MAENMGIFPWKSVEEYEKHMFSHADGSDELYIETAKALNLRGASQLLDLCCGTGRELDEIMKRSPWISVTGIDPSPGLLAKLLAKPYASRLSLIDCTSLSVPLGRWVYDAAVSCNAMHHFPAGDRLALYRKIFDALRPGGRYVEADLVAGCALATAAEDTMRLLREAGFASVEKRWNQDDKAIFVAGKDERK